MQPRTTTGILSLALCAAVATAAYQTHAVIQSDFDDLVYPGEPGNGWVEGWQHPGEIPPQILTDDPIDNDTPYLHFDITGSTGRNVMRQYESGAGVDITRPHFIRWKFRLSEDDFDSNFTVFNDRAHFFARNSPRLTASTDAAMSWGIMAAGAAHATGAAAGQTFWIFDNIDGSGAFNLENHVDSLVVLRPHHVYSFEVLVFPGDQTYSTSIVDETSGASFTSSAPHAFRASGVTATSHTQLHFGVLASLAAEPRAFDLDSVSISQWDGPFIENVVPAPFVIHPPEEGIQFEVSAIEPVPEENITVRLNGNDVTQQLVIVGTETHWTVSYSGLAVDEEYELEITVTNAAGTATLTQSFYTATEDFVLYDSEGFTSDDLYPVGPLQAVTHGRATWQPHGDEPSEIRDDFEDGKVLDRENWLEPRADWLHLPSLASGTVVVEFDAKVSRTDTRTFDVSLMPVSGGAMSSMLGWGVISDMFAYFDGSEWVPLMELDTEWHHYRIVHYLSGPAAGFYDVIVDGTSVADRLRWRNEISPGTPFSRFRLHSHQAGDLFEFGRIDNLVITGAPEDPDTFPPPTIVNVSPSAGDIVRPEQGLHFEVTSPLPISGSDIAVLLNETDVSDGLEITGSSNHLVISYNSLEAETNYAVEIRATNPAGTTTATLNFIATEQEWMVHPAEGWVGPWETTSGTPELRTEDTLEMDAPYLRLDTSGGIRNFMRQYEPGAAVDIAQPHFIRWKFRVSEDDFDSNFTVFNDRVHFFAHPVSRLGGSTTGGNSWAIIAAGAQHASGAAAGQTFWIYDNITGEGDFTPENHVDSQVVMRPHHVYSFEVLVFPEDQSYEVVLVDETSGASFTSSAPHRFRDLSATPTSHTFLHFGTQASPGTVSRPFDFSSLSITPAVAMGVTLLNPMFADGVFSFSFQSEDGVTYTVLRTDDLGSGEWTVLTTIAGDGGLQTVADPDPGDGQGYYRVQAE